MEDFREISYLSVFLQKFLGAKPTKRPFIGNFMVGKPF